MKNFRRESLISTRLYRWPGNPSTADGCIRADKDNPVQIYTGSCYPAAFAIASKRLPPDEDNPMAQLKRIINPDSILGLRDEGLQIKTKLYIPYNCPISARMVFLVQPIQIM